MRADDARRALGNVDAWRAAPLATWLLSVLACVALVGLRGAPKEVTRAARDMRAGHQLSPEDIRSRQMDALVAHYLKEDVTSGQVLDSDLVSNASLPRTPDNALAVVVQARPDAGTAGLAVGTPAALYLGTRQIGPVGRVAALECARLACSVTVAYPSTIHLDLDPADLAKASVKSVKPAASSPHPSTPAVPDTKG